MSFSDKLESLAAKATKGKWKHLSMGVKSERAEANGRTFVAGTHNQERIYTNHDGGTTPSFDADYIECVQPSVGLAVARALRAAESRPWIKRMDTVMKCLCCGALWRDYRPETEEHSEDCAALPIQAALAALEATEGA